MNYSEHGTVVDNLIYSGDVTIHPFPNKGMYTTYIKDRGRISFTCLMADLSQDIRWLNGTFPWLLFINSVEKICTFYSSHLGLYTNVYICYQIS